MPLMTILTTTREVIEALGGVPALTRKLGLKHESVVRNWIADEGFPARSYVAIQALLRPKRLRAADSLFPKMLGVRSVSQKEAA